MVGSGVIRARCVRGRVLGGVAETMIALDEAQRWADYVAALGGPMVTTTIELAPTGDSHTFSVDSVRRIHDGLLIDALDEDGNMRTFGFKIVGDE